MPSSLNRVVTSAVDETTLGAHFEFEDLGTRALEGIDRSFRLFTVEPLVTR